MPERSMNRSPLFALLGTRLVGVAVVALGVHTQHEPVAIVAGCVFGVGGWVVVMRETACACLVVWGG